MPANVSVRVCRSFGLLCFVSGEGPGNEREKRSGAQRSSPSPRRAVAATVSFSPLGWSCSCLPGAFFCFRLVTLLPAVILFLSFLFFFCLYLLTLGDHGSAILCSKKRAGQGGGEYGLTD